MHTKHQKAGIKATRGLSLVEVLVASAIGLVVILGSAQSLMFAIQSGAVARSVLTENDFNQTINKLLGDKGNCNNIIKQLKTTRGVGDLTGLFFGDYETDPDDQDFIIKSGTTFKGDIDVVRLELKKKGTETDKGLLEFTAHYKKNSLGELNTIAGNKCQSGTESGNQQGCYTKKCELSYDYTDADNPTCKADRDCHPIVLTAGFGGGGYPCPWGSIYWKKGERTGVTGCKAHETTANDGGKGGCCDDRTNKGTGTCARPEGATFVSGNDSFQTFRSEINGKCKCDNDTDPDNENDRITTVDGRCIKKVSSYSPENCFPRGEEGKAGNDFTSLRRDFCSKEYQGSEFCIKEFESFSWDTGTSGFNTIKATDKGKKIAKIFHGAFNHSIAFTTQAGGADYYSGAHNRLYYIAGRGKIIRHSYYKRVYNRETGDVHCVGTHRYYLTTGSSSPNISVYGPDTSFFKPSH